MMTRAKTRARREGVRGCGAEGVACVAAAVGTAAPLLQGWRLLPLCALCNIMVACLHQFLFVVVVAVLSVP